MIKVEVEKMNDEFTKYHLIGLPFDAVIHHFTNENREKNEDIHNHPFPFTTHILKGSYVEKLFKIKNDGTWMEGKVLRKAGDSYKIQPNHIHQIVELPEKECWTLILPEPKVQEPGFYKFTDEGIFYRQWNQEDFQLLD